MTAEAIEGTPLALDENDRRRVGELARFLEAHRLGSEPGDILVLAAPDGEQQALLPPLVHALQMLSLMLARGDKVALVPVDKELSVDEVAVLLNVSRPFLEKLLDDGVIPSMGVGARRRIQSRDVLGYRQRRSEENKRLLDEALSFAQEHGVYD
jgi:excisionase family DNA binding protein